MAPETDSAPVSLRRHGVAAWCALILSVLLHGFLLYRLPPFLLGGLMEHPPFPDYPAIALGQVEREPRTKAVPQARFRPENPQEVAEAWGGEGALATMTSAQLPVPEMPEISTGPVKGEAEALAEPPPVDTIASAWDPRQEILQIERPQLDDRAAALPRRYVATAPRADQVPDVVLPMDQPTAFAQGWSGGLPAGIESLSRPTLHSEGDPAGLGTVVPSEPPLLSLLPAELPVLSETVLAEPEASTPPVEQYLQLATRVFQPTDEPGFTYFELQISRRTETTLPVLPKDVLLVQDCSESMTPWKLAECKRGLIRWLEQLNPGDRFDVLAFRDTTTRCFGDWQPFDAVHKAQALAFIDSLRAQGNTDVYASLQAALAVASSGERPVIVALITDGRPTTGMTASSSIIEGFTAANQGRLSVFGLGGGARVNRFLLDLLSYRNRGDSLIVEETEKIPYAMDRWGGETRRPVLSGLSYQFSGVPAEDVYPTTLTHLYLDRPLKLYGRVASAETPAAFQIVGQNGGQTRDMVFPLDLAQASRGEAGIRTQWVWHRIYEWIGAYLRAPSEEQLGAIQDLADRHGLAVPYGFGRTVPRW